MSTAVVDQSPTRFGSVVAVVAGALALVLTGAYSWFALVAGSAGFVLVLAGVAVGSRRTITLGATVLVGSALVAGVQGVHPLVLVLASVASLLAWDAGTTAIGLGRQLGRHADTARLELLHTGTSVAVGLAVGGVAYVLFVAISGGASTPPVTAVVFLLLATVFLASLFR